MKTCRICKRTLQQSEFHKDKKAPDGLCRECKECKKKISLEYQNTHVTGKCVICDKEVIHKRKYCETCKINIRTSKKEELLKRNMSIEQTKKDRQSKLELRRMEKQRKIEERLLDPKKYAREYQRAWRNKNPEKYWAEHAINSKKRNNRFTVTLTVKELLDKIVYKCPLCGARLYYGSKETDVHGKSPSLDRINNEDTVNKDNTWIICLKCNATKSNRTLQEFIDYCTKISKYKQQFI